MSKKKAKATPAEIVIPPPVPAEKGTKAHLVAQLDEALDTDDCDYIMEEIIRAHLMKPAHKEWMAVHGYGWRHINEGKYTIDEEKAVCAIMRDWNNQLGKPGYFSDDEDGEDMLEAIEGTFGEMGVEVDLGDED